jgi:hypothetical protein
MRCAIPNRRLPVGWRRGCRQLTRSPKELKVRFEDPKCLAGSCLTIKASAQKPELADAPLVHEIGPE